MQTLTEEQKAVIAEFDGWEIDPDGDTYKGELYMVKDDFFRKKRPSNMPYDTDWNWIMPVYRKVKATYEKHYDRLCEEPELAPIRMWFRIYFHYGQAHPTPLPLALALYEIIKFFNDNNIKAE